MQTITRQTGCGTFCKALGFRVRQSRQVGLAELRLTEAHVVLAPLTLSANHEMENSTLQHRIQLGYQGYKRIALFHISTGALSASTSLSLSPATLCVQQAQVLRSTPPPYCCPGMLCVACMYGGKPTGVGHPDCFGLYETRIRQRRCRLIVLSM